ncbi:MAG: NADH-quinone oxidoreductase subunit NuoG [Pseudomonadota bacterium]
MSDDTVKIEVDGQELEARKGSMLIEATDAAGIYIPRFCYHKNLSVAANCRMCLVEMERAPKPVPACATPVMDGMKVMTRSEKAVSGQRATMEFLLINHPLDCPICDQGGECELQDLALGYGGDIGQYTEGKRVVRDKDIGPLVQTDLTRCIHCTRCVRFGEEIAGLRELGATGRGEHMEIGTYVAKAMTSELSGNVIDVCPVGALTSKPYRYSARAWELQQADGVAPHDNFGSNVHFHIKGPIVKRVVPKDNDDLNQTWLSDRDRFSYQGLNHDSRLITPRVKENGEWRDCDWNTAFSTLTAGIMAAVEKGPEQLGALLSPNATTEECYLMQRLVRGLGSHNVDHRLRQIEFADQAAEPLSPCMGAAPEAYENADAILLLGAHPRHESPLLNLRIRKAALQGAKVSQIDCVTHDHNFNLFQQLALKPSAMVGAAAALLKSVSNGELIEAPVDRFLELAEHSEPLTEIAASLRDAERPIVVLGGTVQRHASRSALCQIAEQIASLSNGTLGYLTDGANAAGAWLAGAVPHRGPGGRALESVGRHSAELLSGKQGALILLGFEPDLDCALSSTATEALSQTDFVAAITAFNNPLLEASADVLLPMAAYAENEGTYVNGFGVWQSFGAAVRPQGDARPAWKKLRVIGEQLGLSGFDAQSCGDVTSEIKALAGSISNNGHRNTPAVVEATNGLGNGALELHVQVPIYSADPLVRRSAALGSMMQAGSDAVSLSPTDAQACGLADGEIANIKVGDEELSLAVVVDDRVAAGVCAIDAGRRATAAVSQVGAAVEVSKS